MTDREKILAWLNCNCQGNDNPDCGNCPFRHGDCAVELPNVIKNLLQEPVAPIFEKHGVKIWPVCGACGWQLFLYPCQDYCHHCGKRVDWSA